MGLLSSLHWPRCTKLDYRSWTAMAFCMCPMMGLVHKHLSRSYPAYFGSALFFFFNLEPLSLHGGHSQVYVDISSKQAQWLHVNYHCWIRPSCSSCILQFLMKPTNKKTCHVIKKTNLHGGFLREAYPQIIPFKRIFHSKPSIFGYSP